MELNVDNLKQKYNIGVDCSVAGSLCLEMAPEGTPLETLDILRVPRPGLLVDFLSVANTRCGESLLWDYANNICFLEEEGKVEEAWDALDSALRDDS